MASVIQHLQHLDRRWIFLLMLLSVALPILFQLRFPEKPTPLTQATFEAIDNLPEGARVLLAFDFDPASEGELGPMATAFVRHCAEKRVRMYFVALWPVGVQMIDDAIQRVIGTDFPELVYGTDYVNLGFKSGGEGVIKVMSTDLRQLYTTDDRGTNIDSIPMAREVSNLHDFAMIINVSAGSPGTKEWVQYAATPLDIPMVAGCTGVQAPLFYPYVPQQLPGLLAAIKGAAEYEKLVLDKYGGNDDARYQEGMRRMGPQLVAHLLMIALIIAGNIVYFSSRRQERLS